MSDDFAIQHWLNLSLTSGLGNQSMRKLLRAFESPAAALRAGEGDLRQCAPSDEVARRIKNEDKTQAINATLKWLRQPNHSILTIIDDAYPKMLLEIDDPPPLLYLWGDAAVLSKTSVAIVGSRNASPAGVENTTIFARALSDAGVAVISGMAHGIDTAAHQGALQGRAGTIAVMGTGVDLVYPKENREMTAQIAEHGALISELPLGTKPLGGNFPRRNRLISGLARACLVVEATLKSGSLITAKTASEQGKDVFAVPGSINSPMHRGCHSLIKQGAKLAENVRDILEDLEYHPSQLPPLPVDAPVKDDRLLECVGFEPTSFDQIAARSEICADELSPRLLELELNRRIAVLPGGKYQRIA